MAWFQSLQADDIDAINQYVTSTPIRTPAAQTLRDQWIKWIDTRSSYDRNFDRATFDAARNKRFDFELANALSEEEREQIRRVRAEGLSAEEMQGEADRRMTGGRYTEASPASAGTLIGIGVGVALASALGGAWLARRR
jgi:hypothetical protein